MTAASALLAEKSAAVERHLERVAARLPTDASALQPMSDASDAVILHLWQAVQTTIDLAISVCVRRGLGSPANYGEAFDKLAEAAVIGKTLASRLVRAAGFRNVVAHAYAALDMARVFRAATEGPGDLRAFLAALRDAG
ncbi:MAG TPA: HepT-like ribonuclease domain-containing protein [Polyangia bacterium]|nr:HepT-like ribonuclease domain-containing protein [Polyangia bacterium]